MLRGSSVSKVRKPTKAAIAAPSTPGSSAVTVETGRSSTSALICAQVGDARGAAAEADFVDRDAGRGLGAREDDAIEECDAFEHGPDEVAADVCSRERPRKAARKSASQYGTRSPRR